MNKFDTLCNSILNEKSSYSFKPRGAARLIDYALKKGWKEFEKKYPKLGQVGRGIGTGIKIMSDIGAGTPRPKL